MNSSDIFKSDLIEASSSKGYKASTSLSAFNRIQFSNYYDSKQESVFSNVFKKITPKIEPELSRIRSREIEQTSNRETLQIANKRSGNPIENISVISNKKFALNSQNIPTFNSIKSSGKVLPLVKESQESRTESTKALTPQIFTGSIEKIMKISKTVNKLTYLYETFGKIMKISTGKWKCEKIILLRQTSGPVLQGIYYEIDYKMDSFEIGDLVRIIARYIGTNRFQIFKITLTTNEQMGVVQRLEVLSEFTLNKQLNCL